MSIAPAPRRSPVRWLAGRFRRRPSTPARSIAAADLFDRDALDRRHAGDRRGTRSNDEIAMTLAAVYGAVRFRSVAITKSAVVLQRRRGDDWEDVTDDHPAALHSRRVNATLSWPRALQLVEEHRLINGNAFWVKRRDGLGIAAGFEVWHPSQVAAIRDPNDPFIVARYRFTDQRGATTTADPEDVIHFRHMLNPADWVWGVSPITAIRLEASAALEAQRYNIKFYDQGARASLTYAMGEGVGDMEASRVEDVINAKMAGTDNAHRIRVLPGAMTPIMNAMSLADMEFLGQQKWTRNETATAFELSPLALKDFEKATYQNADQANEQDWTVVLDQLRATLREINEQFIWPEFGTDLRLFAAGNDIPALESNMKDRAAVDQIYLGTAKVTVNELRERDGQDTVPWGDTPWVSSTLVPADQPRTPAPAPAPPPTQASLRGIPPMPVTTDVPGLLTQERLIAERWRGRLGNEMRGIIQHLDREASRSLRVLSPQHVDTYDWAWEARYGERAIEELAEVFRLSAAAAAFIEVPLLTANIAANTYAAERAGELIGGITDGTRRNIRRAVTETIEQGRPLRELKNQIREMYDFSESRAESIARTETATAQGQGTRAAALSQGRNEKRWVTAGDNRVDPHCSENASVGWIDAQGVFPTGKDTIPDHPRCRCVVQYRTRRD